MTSVRIDAALLVTAALGLLLFAQGFFLTRVELAHKAKDCAVGRCFQDTRIAPPFPKAVILVIDALRIDFVVPKELEQMHDPEASKFYLDKFVSMRHLMLRYPSQCYLARFLADPYWPLSEGGRVWALS